MNGYGYGGEIIECISVSNISQGSSESHFKGMYIKENNQKSKSIFSDKKLFRCPLLTTFKEDTSKIAHLFVTDKDFLFTLKAALRLRTRK